MWREAAAERSFLRLQTVVGTGLFTRTVEVAAIREGGAGGRTESKGAKKRKKFHAGIEPDRARNVNASTRRRN